MRRIGIHPDILVCRASDPLPDDVREKIALFADIDTRAVIDNQNVEDVYLVPEALHDEASTSWSARSSSSAATRPISQAGASSHGRSAPNVMT